MTLSWLMTVQKTGTRRPAIGKWVAGVELCLTAPWLHEPAPNPNRIVNLRHQPRNCELRRPDGTRLDIELFQSSVHINYDDKVHRKRNANGNIRNPWIEVVVLTELGVADVPSGSEIWGEINEEDVDNAKK